MGRRRRKQHESKTPGDGEEVAVLSKGVGQGMTDETDEEPTMEDLASREGVTQYFRMRNSAVKSASNGKEENPKNVAGKSNHVEKKASTRRDAPREISSSRPVRVGRDACVGNGQVSAPARSVRRFDPRFEDHCGDLRTIHVERNYTFLDTVRERRRAELEAVVSRRSATSTKGGKRRRKGSQTTADPKTVDRAAKELERMQQADLRRKAVLTRRQVEKDYKEREKERVRRGKKPYFLKERDMRRLELRKKYDDLKKEGGVKKFIDKKRRRIIGKQKKLLSGPSSNAASA